jgi:hypothetical protein
MVGRVGTSKALGETRVAERRGEAGPCGGPPSTVIWKAAVAEIGGFGGGGLAVHELGDAGKNQHRGEVRRQHVGLSDAKIFEVEFIELAGTR